MKKRFVLIFAFFYLFVIFSCQKNDHDVKTETEILPFNEEANATVDLQRAVEKATLTNKKVLLIFGANWCKWCKALHKMMETDEEINSKLHQTFEVAWINVGRRNKNMDIDARYGSPAANGGIPVFVILDSNGNFITTQKTELFEKTEQEEQPVGYNREKLLNFIKGFTETTSV